MFAVVFFVTKMNYSIGVVLVIFLLVKTLADAIMYVVEQLSFGGYGNYRLQDDRGTADIEDSGLEKCELCGRVIYGSETPWVIKDPVVCKRCFEGIKAKKTLSYKENFGEGFVLPRIVAF